MLTYELMRACSVHTLYTFIQTEISAQEFAADTVCPLCHIDEGYILEGIVLDSCTEGMENYKCHHVTDNINYHSRSICPLAGVQHGSSAQWHSSEV